MLIGTETKTQPLNLPGELSRLGWRLPADLSFDEWTSCGQALSSIEGSVQWWLGDWWAFGEHAYGERVRVLESGGPLEDMNFQTLRNYGWVSRAFETSRRRDVLSFKHHAEVAALPLDEQDRWLDRAEREELSTMKLRSAIRQAAAVDRTRAVELSAANLGKFVVLYADPPWRYENPPMGGSNRSIENHYPTMDIDEICALPVGGIAHEHAILFLWATNPKLAECLQVITAWGFVYRTNMVWVKDKIGMGYHARERHEGLLIAKRGELAPPSVDARPDSVQEAPRTEHSVKPPIFYDLIDRMYPDLRKIELFNRGKLDRSGWHTWGNQAL